MGRFDYCSPFYAFICCCCTGLSVLSQTQERDKGKTELPPLSLSCVCDFTSYTPYSKTAVQKHKKKGRADMETSHSICIRSPPASSTQKHRVQGTGYIQNSRR